MTLLGMKVAHPKHWRVTTSKAAVLPLEAMKRQIEHNAPPR